MGKAVKTDIEYKEILEKSLSAIQYLRIHGFSTYMESEGIVNRIMEAAKLIANSSAALIQAIGMMSENIERANRGESLAYTEDQFMRLIQDNGITYNDVIQRGWI